MVAYRQCILRSFFVNLLLSISDEALRESRGNSMSRVVSPLSPNIVGHIPNEDSPSIEPFDPRNGLQPFVTSCCSDF